MKHKWIKILLLITLSMFLASCFDTESNEKEKSPLDSSQIQAQATPSPTITPAPTVQPTMAPSNAIAENDMEQGTSQSDTYQYVGEWMASPVVGSGYSQRYVLKEDGSFIFGSNQMSGKERIAYLSGTWDVEDGNMQLNIDTIIKSEGGKAVEDTSIYVDGAYLEGEELTVKQMYEPIVKTMTITMPKDSNDSSSKRTMEIDGTTYWEYVNQDFESEYIEIYNTCVEQKAEDYKNCQINTPIKTVYTNEPDEGFLVGYWANGISTYWLTEDGEFVAYIINTDNEEIDNIYTGEWSIKDNYLTMNYMYKVKKVDDQPNNFHFERYAMEQPRTEQFLMSRALYDIDLATGEPYVNDYFSASSICIDDSEFYRFEPHTERTFGGYYGGDIIHAPITESP